MLVIKLSLIFLMSFEKVTRVKTARILAYYPCPSISHQIVFRPITSELVKNGHQVTVITPDPMYSKGSSPENLIEIDVHDVSYSIVKKYFTTAVTGKQTDLINQANIIKQLTPVFFEEHFKLQEVKALLQYPKGHFDLLLLEAYFTAALGLTHKFNAPTILVSSFGAFPGNYETVGAPTHPTIYHNIFRQRLYNLTLWEKLSEMLNYFRIIHIVNEGEKHENKVLQKVFGPDIPPIHILKNNIDMLFLNINPIWEGNYPVTPNVIHMGGLHQKPQKQLPENLQSFLDASNNGVIYFSFGTNVDPSLLPTEKIDIFKKVFSQLPYNVIWKWGTQNLTAQSTKIKVFKWLPQSDLLRHPNVKVFITQGGLQSTDEAITAGVPLVGIPMLADQWYNVEKYVYHKIGVKLDFENLTETQLRKAIVEVAENKSYRNNIKKLRSLMQDQPQTPLERTTWWIEYVLRHGGAKHLRAPAANMSWSEFLELELVSVIILGVLMSLVLIIAIIRIFIFYVSKNGLFNTKLKNI